MGSVGAKISKAEGVAASGMKTEMGTSERLAQSIIGIVVGAASAASVEALFTISHLYSRNNECIDGSSCLGFPSWKLGAQYTFSLENHVESLIFLKSYSNLY